MPQVERLVQEDGADDRAVVAFLKDTTMVRSAAAAAAACALLCLGRSPFGLTGRPRARALLFFFQVGLLPVPHPIVIRKYQPNRHTNMWFTTFLWGLVFLRNQENPLFDGSKIKLFSVMLRDA